MSDPTTLNVLLSVPTRGSDVNTWDVPMNGNYTAIDGYAGGVQTISLTNSPVTLTSPAGTPTPSAGPTQAQNAVLKFTGTLTANVQVTLPLPGFYIIDNQCSVASFALTFRALGSGQVIAIDQGEVQHIYNDGLNVRFCNLGRTAAIEIWGGLNAIPTWVSACTVAPYLLCNGSGYSTTTYVNLFRKIGYAFGGSGSTFLVPDLRGRVPLPYDDFGRITAGGCGLAGNVLGATLDEQTIVLSTAQLPPYTPSGGVGVTLSADGLSPFNVVVIGAAANSVTINGPAPIANFYNTSQYFAASASASFTGNPQGGVSAAVPNVQPSIVTGIAVIRTGA